MRKFCLQWMVCLGLVLMAGSAMAFSLNTGFEGVTIHQTDLTTTSGQNQWNDLVRWQIVAENGNSFAQQTPNSLTNPTHETSLLFYGFDATGLGVGTPFSLEFDFINSGPDTSIGKVFLGGLKVLPPGQTEQKISPFAPWPNLDTTNFFDADLATTDVWTHASYTGIVPDDFDVLYVAFRLGGTSGLRGIDNVSLDVGSNDSNGAAPVPEPSTFLLLGAGMAGLALWRRKKIQA